jgi:hypothetical protein
VKLIAKQSTFDLVADIRITSCSKKRDAMQYSHQQTKQNKFRAKCRLSFFMPIALLVQTGATRVQPA